MIEKITLKPTDPEINVSKTMVEGSKKDVNIPIICIPATEYAMICRLASKHFQNIKKICKNFSEYMGDSDDICIHILNDNLDAIESALISAWDSPYNNDCKEVYYTNKKH